MNTNYFETLFTTDATVIAANVAEEARIFAAETAANIENNARVKAFAIEKLATQCPKCMGSGILRQYIHRAGGVCFKCGGTGKR